MGYGGVTPCTNAPCGCPDCNRRLAEYLEECEQIIQKEVNRAVVRQVLGLKDTDEILPGGRVIPGVHIDGG